MLSLDTQGCSPPRVTPIPDPSWPSLLSSSQGWAMSSVPTQARFFSDAKTGKLTSVLHTLQRKSCSWAARSNSLTSLLHGEGPGLSRMDLICLLPRDHWPQAPQPWHVPKGRGHNNGQSPSAGCPPNAGRDLDVSHTCPITEEPLVEEIWRRLCRTASPGPAHRAHSSTAAHPQHPPPPSSPARLGQAHGRRWC